MTYKYPPLLPKLPEFLHGGDYNPEQWLHMPEFIKDDYRMMKLANCNVMTLGVFSWSMLEPEEGKFNFDWLDKSMTELYNNGVYTILATPSAARPPWLAQKYPEVLRVQRERRKNLFGGRHNHCYTSPVYREKIAIINTKLAERYKDHPGLVLWHVSNEFGGECHCPLCQDAFRNFCKSKYDNDLQKLNQTWYTAFWSQRYSDWSQIESPSLRGQPNVHGLNLDWKRFVSFQTADYMQHEISILKKITPQIPVTTNLMGTYPEVDYWQLAKHLDIVSWDNYPLWHADCWFGNDFNVAMDTAFKHDLNRSLKGGKPFLLMESTPSFMSWVPVAKPKRPGMHVLSSLQAVAHGADSVQYFQWRQSRGNCEKFHGGVVVHGNSTQTRAFQDVTEVGAILKKLKPMLGSTRPAEVGLIFDWENRWAIEGAKAPRNDDKKEYEQTCIRHYGSFMKQGITVDIINMDCDFSTYKLLLAPMLYMIRKGVGARIESFVQQGGTFITTYQSGMVDENDLCFLNGFPGPLRKVLGIWIEETYPLYHEESDMNGIRFLENNQMGLFGEYTLRHYCELLHVENAEVLAVFKQDFFASRPAVTVNHFAEGKAYYIASRNEDRFLDDFFTKIINNLNLQSALDAELPKSVYAQKRTDGKNNYIFIMNFADNEQQVDLKHKEYLDMLSGKKIKGCVDMKNYGVLILKEKIA